MKTTEVQAILQEMGRLLRIGSCNDWAVTYENLSRQIAITPNETARRILASYGGMGSLNDIVLQSKGVILQHENEQFDALRSRLYLLCTQLLRAT